MRSGDQYESDTNDKLHLPQNRKAPPKDVVARIHPCSADEFDNLDDLVDCTELQDDDDALAQPATEKHSARMSLTGHGVKQRFSLTRYHNPNASDAGSDGDAMTTTEKVEAGVGLMYVVATVLLSVYYLDMLMPSMANDLWWAGFNTSGAQSFLIDTLNAELNLRGNGTVNLTSPLYGAIKDYSQFYTPIEVTPTYDRVLVHDAGLTNLVEIVASLTTVTGPDVLLTQYCWIDFNRTWEVAHTDKRQARCNARYLDNAAMYWETMCRIMDWNTWMVTNGHKFMAVMGRSMNATARGKRWLADTPYAFKGVDSEVVQWQKAGLTRFVLQFANNFKLGVDETITVTNAFGGSQAMTLKRMPSESRSSLWTTMILMWGPWNDFQLALDYGYSYIRTDPANHRFRLPCNYTQYLRNPANYSCVPCDPQFGPPLGACAGNYQSVLGLPTVLPVVLTNGIVGPFGSIDAFVVPAPPSVVSLYVAFRASVMTLLQSNATFRDAMMAVPTMDTDPVPLTWQRRGLMYWGGDLTCPRRQPLSYVQTSFAFDASCVQQDAQVMSLHKFNVLFGLQALDPSIQAAKTLCSLTPRQPLACATVVNASLVALDLFRAGTTAEDKARLLDMTVAATNAASAAQVQTIQFASDMIVNRGLLLQEQLVTVEPHRQQLSLRPWQFFGWLYVYDWAMGSREVVSFEGDMSTQVLISDKYVPQPAQARDLEVQKSACQYLWVVSVVVTGLLVGVGVVVVAYTAALRGRVVGRNFMQFNRIAGAVWVSRPLLVIRGMTAIILLSTSPTEFRMVDGISGFHFVPRTVFQSMVVAGESTWISYVIQDILAIATNDAEPVLSNATTLVSWFMTVLYDYNYPCQIETALHRDCTIQFGRRVTCDSATVQIGQSGRVLFYLIAQITTILVAMGLLQLWRYYRMDGKPLSIAHLLLSGTATAYLTPHTLDNGAWVVDRASCVMCGLLTLRDYVFDLKLWLVVREPQTDVVKWSMRAFHPSGLEKFVGQLKRASQVELLQTAAKPSHNRYMALAGLGYMGATIFGSVAYLQLTQTNMANDIWWANYNASLEHTFLLRLFNQELVLRPRLGAIRLDDPTFLDDSNYSQWSPHVVPVSARPLYVTQVKSAVAVELAVVVRGLRAMDGCKAPWIATQYCWLDFAQQWEMASTPARQRRCRVRYATNAAVFLEAVLRNIQWNAFQECCGTSLDVGLVGQLNQTTAGQTWWAAVQATPTSVDEEVTVWQGYNLTRFQTDWQNYKTTGLIDTISVQNAFGYEYPMTLKQTNGSFRVASQTSMKMYWGFASDLWAVATPGALMYGKSLIRQSAQFAFTNFTTEHVLVQNGSLVVSTLTTGAFFAFRREIGPFGSVDLKTIAPPPSLVRYVTALKDTVATARYHSKDFSWQFGILEYVDSFTYVPHSWLRSNFTSTVGGNPMCHDLMASTLSKNLYRFAGFNAACNVAIGEVLRPTALNQVGAVLGANISHLNQSSVEATRICTQTPSMAVDACKQTLLRPVFRLVNNRTFFPDDTTIPGLAALAKTAQDDVRRMFVEIMQYVRTSPTAKVASILRKNIFDPAESSFDYFGWLLAIEWTLANREVVSFQGDWGMLNVLTTVSDDVNSVANALEIPVNVALYVRSACVYVTCVVICVAVLATMYLLLSRGYVEGLNLLEINRVAGIVWIGRTILFIRSIAAICLLSTQALALERVNIVYLFQSASDIDAETTMEAVVRYAKTFLAAGEVSWLGFVLSDMLMVVTQQHTTAYVFKCNFLIWGISALLSVVFPVKHRATLNRVCKYTQMDFQLVCTNGTVAIGSVGRLLTLMATTALSIGACYVYERVRHPDLAPTSFKSYLLAASAQYVFISDGWVDHDAVYIDRASALINGLVSVRYGSSFYVFDLKLWRLFVIDSRLKKHTSDKNMRHLVAAIPLPE